jgi:hypothetical protein
MTWTAAQVVLLGHAQNRHDVCVLLLLLLGLLRKVFWFSWFVGLPCLRAVLVQLLLETTQGNSSIEAVTGHDPQHTAHHPAGACAVGPVATPCTQVRAQLINGSVR